MPSDIVYQHQQQTPINGTISGMAPPGNETGYYYVPVANLPWQTSWQELKDHVRTVCSVEHVEINEDSTSGHVVLKGRANFDAAFRLLNGGIFQDRALIADGRNADNWVLIKQHVDGPASSQPPIMRHPPNPIQHISPLIVQSPSDYGDWSAAPTGQGYMMTPTMDSPACFAPYTIPSYADSTILYGTVNCPPENPHMAINPTAMCPSGSSYTQQQHTPSGYYGNSYPIPHDDMTSQGSDYHAEAVSMSRRKIIIRQLQPHVNESQILELIRHKAGSASERLQKLEMPPSNSQQETNRGYAIATFESEDAAEKVIRRLNNYQYEGRFLEARYTKEDTSNAPPSHRARFSYQRHSHHHSRHHSHREHHDERDEKGKGKESLHKPAISAERKGKSFASNPDVIIANGSSVPQA
ncbi:hypothetical protein SAMD00023353_1200350 [Rosellinia necatrix]|uniref:RRM domain-containing protein n=1 Tax=Rosellinia necatrix TaxID=77044 RepID=A0A1W2TLQ4_ROSNE|nr:hypothetical protein SAMD00023353_1200350 [Rosellinia necatrix]